MVHDGTVTITPENGLARTERQILELVNVGHTDFQSLFRADQQREERIFMGDASFARFVPGRSGCRHPLLLEERGAYSLTSTSRSGLAKLSHNLASVVTIRMIRR